MANKVKLDFITGLCENVEYVVTPAVIVTLIAAYVNIIFGIDAAYSPVVTEQKSKDKDFLALYRNTKRDAEKTKQTTALEEYWSNTARKNYQRAVELANQAAALAK